MLEDRESCSIFKKAIQKGIDRITTPISPFIFGASVLLTITGFYSLNTTLISNREKDIKRERDIRNILSLIDSSGRTYNGNIAAKEIEFQPLLSGIATYKTRVNGIGFYPNANKSDLTRHIFGGLVADINNELKNVKTFANLTEEEIKLFDRAIFTTKELTQKINGNTLPKLYEANELQRVEKDLDRAVDRFIEHDTEKYVVYLDVYKDDSESSLK